MSFGAVINIVNNPINFSRRMRKLNKKKNEKNTHTNNNKLNCKVIYTLGL